MLYWINYCLLFATREVRYESSGRLIVLNGFLKLDDKIVVWFSASVLYFSLHTEFTDIIDGAQASSYKAHPLESLSVYRRAIKVNKAWFSS